MTNFRLELADPWWLLCLAVVPVLYWYHRRTLVDLPATQRQVSVLLRILIVLLLVFCLCGLTLLSPTQDQHIFFLIDESASLGQEARDAAQKYILAALEKKGRNQVSFIRFASTPKTIESQLPTPPLKTDGTPNIPDALTKEWSQGTDIAAALGVASAGLPPSAVGRMILLSDGNPTQGDTMAAALRTKVPIDVVPLPVKTDPEVQVSAVNAPAQVQEGEPFNVEIVIDSNHDDPGTPDPADPKKIGVLIEVYRGPHKVLSERKPLKKGENRFKFVQQVTGDRLAQFTARVSGAQSDTLLDNNSANSLVFASGKPKVLLIESDVKEARHLATALEEEGIKVDIRPAQGLPESLSDLQNYEALLLSNVPATALNQKQMETVRTYVQDLGGGFIMLGGDQSFGLGGYYKTAIEEILPVRSDFEKEKEKPSLAMVLVIDKSGSMGGSKIEMAKDAAKAAVELLGPSDKVGVIAFEADFQWVSELQSASNKSRILDDISRIEAGGGTVMYPPMEEGYKALQNTVAKLKHMIILTDGVSEPGDFEGISQSMAQSRITVSTVGIAEGPGDVDEKVLQDIARIGNGRYYYTEDPNSIPQIFAKETVTASKAAINEQPFTPLLLRPTPVLADINIKEAPFLLGYVITRPKATSELILATENGDPLLSWWRYGLGMTCAFTSDAKSRWASEWLAWPGYGKFWAQLIRQVMRKAETKGTIVTLDRQGGQATLTLDAADPTGKYLNGADARLTVLEPNGNKKELTLPQVAPGRYSANFAANQSGAYHLEMNQQNAGRLVARQSRGFIVGYPEELRLKPLNEELLKRISAGTGGRYHPDPTQLFAETERTADRALPLWHYLIMAVLLLFLADVALRRIDFSLLSRWNR